MQFYRITNDPTISDTVKWAATLDDAKTEGRAQWPSTLEDVRIELVEIPTDKGSLVYIFRNGPDDITTVVRTWKFTPRGALVEIANGD